MVLQQPEGRAAARAVRRGGRRVQQARLRRRPYVEATASRSEDQGFHSTDFGEAQI